MAAPRRAHAPPLERPGECVNGDGVPNRSLLLSALVCFAAGTIVAHAATFVGGTLSASASWSGSINVTSTVVVPSPFTLTIQPGTIVLLTNGAGITASGGGEVEVAGTAEQPVTFNRVNTSFSRWGDLLATGAGSTMTIRHAKISRGRVRATSNGTALVEDCELSEMNTTGIIGGNGGALFTVRRTWVHDYVDIDLINTRTIAEDSLFERVSSDIFELQNSPPGSVLRRCTFRDCINPNSDGVDMNGCTDVLIDSCLIYKVTDKAISSGSAGSASDPTTVGLVVTNTLIYGADIGIGIKDNGTAALFNNTITDCREGVAVYQKFSGVGGHVTNGANNIIWGVTNAIVATDGGTVATFFSDLQDVVWPGAGNISADPLFLDATARDFRLASASPARLGLNGIMGAQFPVGAPMAASHPQITSVVHESGTVRVRFWADPKHAYLLEMSDSVSGPAWNIITNVPARPIPVLIHSEVPAVSSRQFIRLRAP